MNAQTLRHNNLNYVIRYPKGYDEAKKYPLIIFLHGAGGREDPVEKVMNFGCFAAAERFDLDAVMIAPHGPYDSWFDVFEQLQEFAVFAASLDFIDSDRVYLMGGSMGGYTAWQLAMSRPELFAALVPICGGGMYWNASRLKDIPVWAWHGRLDRTVFCEESEKMVAAINKRGGNARLTICEDVAHNSWENAFASAELFEWMLAQKKARKED